MSLVRFRADPAKVRVSIRRSGKHWWHVTIMERSGDSIGYRLWGTSPRKALVKALRYAESRGVLGIDLAMQWSYHHPWR